MPKLSAQPQKFGFDEKDFIGFDSRDLLLGSHNIDMISVGSLARRCSIEITFDFNLDFNYVGIHLVIDSYTDLGSIRAS